MFSHRLISLGAVLVLLSLTAPAVAQTAGAAPDVSDVTYTGEGTLDAADAKLELWRASAHEFTVTVATESAFEGEACLVTASDDADGTVLTCRSVRLPANTTQDVSLGIDGWPGGQTGTQRVELVLRSNGSVVAASGSLSLTVLEENGDVDDDGLENARELAVGSDLRTADTDGDGLVDGDEVHTYETAPTNVDSDGDGLRDRAEVDTHGTDPTVADSDDDGLPDGREVSLGTSPNKADSDGDGLGDAKESNTYETNATNADTDGDGLGDGVEVNRHETNPTVADTDDDGLEDALEINTYKTDPNTVDSDGDGLGDGVEVEQHQTDPAAADTDGDGLPDGTEVNTHETSPTNADTDDDGLDDGPEVNRYGTDPTNADTDGDGVGDRAEVNPQPWSHLPLPLIAFGTLATVIAGGLLYRSDREFDVSLAWLRPGGQGSAVGDEVDTTPPEATASTVADVPPEFLSNEERVQRLLEDNDGRMRQSEIVDRTGWSKSKVSRVLADMDEHDQVVKVDVGKGNVITLPERVPPGAESPFDE